MVAQLRQYEVSTYSDPFRSPDWRYKCAEAFCFSSDSFGFEPATKVKRQWASKFKKHMLRKEFTEALAVFLAARSALSYEEVQSIGDQQDADGVGEIAEAYVQNSIRNAELATYFGDVSTAYNVYADKSRALLRAELEGRVLAGCDNATIAKQLGTDVNFVSTYVKYFFDVRPKLKNPSYIHRIVLKYQPGLGTTGYEMEDQVRYWGYHAGVLFLDAFLHQDMLKDDDTSESDADRLDGLFVKMLRAKALSGLATMDVNKYNIVQLLTLHAELYHKRLELRNNADEQGAYDKLISNILSVAEWKVGVKAAEAAAKTPAGRYYETAAELRTEELFRLQREDDPTLAIEHTAFPQRRKETEGETTQ